METLDSQLNQLIHLLTISNSKSELKIRTLINQITDKIKAINSKSKITIIESEVNDYDFNDDILN